jgi:hypothetical protein
MFLGGLFHLLALMISGVFVEIALKKGVLSVRWRGLEPLVDPQ